MRTEEGRKHFERLVMGYRRRLCDELRRVHWSSDEFHHYRSALKWFDREVARIEPEGRPAQDAREDAA